VVQKATYLTITVGRQNVIPCFHPPNAIAMMQRPTPWPCCGGRCGGCRRCGNSRFLRGCLYGGSLRSVVGLASACETSPETGVKSCPVVHHRIFPHGSAKRATSRFLEGHAVLGGEGKTRARSAGTGAGAGLGKDAAERLCGGQASLPVGWPQAWAGGWCGGSAAPSDRQECLSSYMPPVTLSGITPGALVRRDAEFDVAPAGGRRLLGVVEGF